MAYLAVGFWVLNGLWIGPSGRTLADNPADQVLVEWFLAHHGNHFGLLTHALNAPDGVNLLANASTIGLGVLFAPVTWLFGAPATFALVATLNLAGTAIAWYLLFARTLKANQLGAALGGAFCGFAPGMISQNNSHLHMTAQWLVPVMVWCVVRMLRAAEEGRRTVVIPLVLGVLAAAQVFIGEEVLFLAALTLALMAVGYALAAPRYVAKVAPRFAVSAGIAVAVGVALLTYPLWFQFDGPQSVPNAPFPAAYYSADVASFTATSPLSLLGGPDTARLATGPAEYNTFLGWPLVLASLAAVVWLWRRRPLVPAIALAAAVMTAFSLGPRVVIDGERTDQWAPFSLILDAPVISAALPQRFALALIPLIGTLIALAVDKAMADEWPALRVLVPAIAVVALLPVAPAPLPTMDRPAPPVFFSAGHWKQCVRPGGVLVPVPLPTPQEPWPMRYATATGVGFRLPEGFFIAPYGPEGRASMGTYKQPTSQLLANVAAGQPVVVGEAERAQAAADVAFWGASCVVLPDGAANQIQLRTTVDALFGPGERIADAWVWKVSS